MSSAVIFTGVIWTAVALIIAAVAVVTRRARKPVSFFSGVSAPQVRDVRAYNRAVARLWGGYAVVFEALGVPLLFRDRSKALMAIPLLGIPLSALALVIAYHAILRRMQKPRDTSP